MESLRPYDQRAESVLSSRIVALLTAIHAAQARTSLLSEREGAQLDRLVEVAKVQSTAASNSIEGIRTSDARMAALMAEKTTPHNRDEEEISGYRDVLNTIHEQHDYIPVTPNVILQLHRDLFRHTPLSFGGHFKDTDNVIMEVGPQGANRVRFRPPSALVTPDLVEEICRNYRQAIALESVDPLLAISMFVFDFTCIHPFNDGNGRMSRLLTLLLMYQSGFTVGKYVSLEHLIEQSKDTYYEALAASTAGWPDANDYAPFVQYLLSVMLDAYKELEDRLGPQTKAERIRRQLRQTVGTLSKRELREQLPDISETTIERELRRLLDEGEIEKVGKGRSTRYRYVAMLPSSRQDD
ncbi:Fic family protein [Bifidobacterium choloepi]|uniref:Fic family protein n=1 Tax=Bifidobacterium choloepi TaxID=2614131 RepID=A0A6I5MZ65_9BIFI|nr:Fic family protein [Bifidobacterium choloepi]NEG69938.1 Fic family protein [Bifidobacterium choloepi]